MLVVAHHTDVGVRYASLRDTTTKLRIHLRTEPLAALCLARVVAAAAHAQLQHLIEHGVDETTLERVVDEARDELAYVSVRHPVSEEDARVEAAAVLAERADLLGRVTQHIRVGRPSPVSTWLLWWTLHEATLPLVRR